MPENADGNAASAPNPEYDAQLLATAYHEAGHAVMAIYVGRDVQKVTIAPGHLEGGGMRLGLCHMKKGRSKKSKDVVEEDAMILLAGMVGESHLTGQYRESGARQDLLGVQRLLQNRAGNARQLDRLMRRILDKTEYTLDEPHCSLAIKQIALVLIEKTTIGGRAARHIFEQAEQQR